MLFEIFKIMFILHCPHEIRHNKRILNKNYIVPCFLNILHWNFLKTLDTLVHIILGVLVKLVRQGNRSRVG